MKKKGINLNINNKMKSIIRLSIIGLLLFSLIQMMIINAIIQKNDDSYPIGDGLEGTQGPTRKQTSSTQSISIYPESRSNQLINSSDITLENNDQLTIGVFSDAAHGHAGHETGIYCSWFIDELANDCSNSNEIGMMDFAISVGDLGWDTLNWVDGDSYYYPQSFQQFIDNLNIPWFCALGNHDICAYDRDPYRKSNDSPYTMLKHYLNETEQTTATYAVCKDNILFLFIGDKGSNYKLHNTQYEWLEYMCQRYSDLTTVIVTHQGIWETTYDIRSGEGEDYTYYDNSTWWAELFNNNPQIKLYLHGHNHYFDYVITNKMGSEFHKQGHGIGAPYFYNIGHKIAFISAPIHHSAATNQKSNDDHDIDEIMVLNISSTFIEWNIWRHNETYQGWIDEPNGHPGKPYSVYKWNIPTTFQPSSGNWYSIPVFLQDEELQILDNHIVSNDIRLELIGSKDRELFTNPHLDHYTSFQNVGFPGLRGEKIAQKDDGIMRETGIKTIHFPSRYLDGRKWDGGKSGQLKNFISCGSTPQLVPGKIYNITITAKANVNANIKVICNATDWSKKSQYNFVPESEQLVIDAMVGTTWTTLTGQYITPKNDDIWFISGRIELADSAKYQITKFSIKRDGLQNSTHDFFLNLNGVWYNHSGILAENEYSDFSVVPNKISNNDGTLSFKASINGNKVGMARLIYYNPIFVRAARLRINEFDPNNNCFDVCITQDISSDHWKDLDNKVLPLNPNANIELYSTVIKSYSTGNLRQYFAGNINSPTNLSIVLNKLPKTILYSPPDSNKTSNNKPTFQWKFSDPGLSKQIGFQVLISNDKEFMNINYDSGEQITSNEYWEFPQGTHYTEISDGIWYWKVIVKNHRWDLKYISEPFSLIIDTIINPPSNLIAYPDTWTAVNSFKISWDNPNDISGISGCYYKLDKPPQYNEDGSHLTGNDTNCILNLSVIGGGVHNVYVWLEDYLNNINFQNYNFTKLYLDNTPPKQPENITVTQRNRVTKNRLEIDWTDPIDDSGIKIGAYCFIGSDPPRSQQDGKWYPSKPINITMSLERDSKIYIWLEDKSGNLNHKNYGIASYKNDKTSPSKPGVIITPNTWSSINRFIVNWTEPYDISGITRGVYYLIRNDPPESIEECIWISQKPFLITKAPEGKTNIHIWLEDNGGNTYYSNYGTGILYFDLTHPKINHTPDLRVIKGENIVISATVVDDNSGVNEVNLFIRNSNSLSFSQYLLKKNGSSYSINISSDFITSDNLEYYLMASDRSSPSNIIFYGHYGMEYSVPSSLIRLNVFNPPKILEVTPLGKGIPTDTEISITFNKPMLKNDFENAFSIHPTVAGSFEWNDNKLIFIPKERFDTNTEYTIIISRNAIDIDGIPISKEFRWSFYTEKSELSEKRVDNFENDLCLPMGYIILIFIFLILLFIFLKSISRL